MNPSNLLQFHLMSRVLSVPLLILSLVLLSCSKTDLLQDPEQDQIGQYSRLSVGNQWIYESFLVDRDGIEQWRINDTILIQRDTMINGMQYFVEIGSYDGDPITRLLYEDGQSLLVYPEGAIRFTLDSSIVYQHYTTVSNDSIAITEYNLATEQEVLVPAGQFRAWEYIGTNRIFNLPTESYERYYYTLGVGLVLKSCEFVSARGSRIEQPLLSYSVRP